MFRAQKLIFLQILRKHSSTTTTTTVSSSKLPSTKSLLDVYNEQIEPTLTSSAKLVRDTYQENVLRKLQYVADRMTDYKPIDVPVSVPGSAAIRSSAFFSKFFKFVYSDSTILPPKGLYIYGAVGGGKTMLMDLFYEYCDVSVW